MPVASDGGFTLISGVIERRSFRFFGFGDLGRVIGKIKRKDSAGRDGRLSRSLLIKDFANN